MEITWMKAESRMSSYSFPVGGTQTLQPQKHIKRIFFCGYLYTFQDCNITLMRWHLLPNIYLNWVQKTRVSPPFITCAHSSTNLILCSLWEGSSLKIQSQHKIHPFIFVKYLMLAAQWLAKGTQGQLEVAANRSKASPPGTCQCQSVTKASFCFLYSGLFSPSWHFVFKSFT